MQGHYHLVDNAQEETPFIHRRVPMKLPHSSRVDRKFRCSNCVRHLERGGIDDFDRAAGELRSVDLRQSERVWVGDCALWANRS